MRCDLDNTPKGLDICGMWLMPFSQIKLHHANVLDTQDVLEAVA